MGIGARSRRPEAQIPRESDEEVAFVIVDGEPRTQHVAHEEVPQETAAAATMICE